MATAAEYPLRSRQMRVHDSPVEITAEVAGRLLTPIVGPCTVIRVRALRGGNISTVFEVRLGGPHKDLVLKIYPERCDWKLAKEVFVYGLLAGNPSLPVPDVVGADAGHQRIPASYLVLTKRPGRILKEESSRLRPGQIRTVYEQLGRHLRSIHEVTFDAFGYLYDQVIDPHPTNRAYMTSQFAKKLAEFRRFGADADLARGVEKFVADRGDALDVCEVAVLCHNDYHEGNILVRDDAHGQPHVSAILDVENAIAADPLIDLAKTRLYSIRDDDLKWQGLLDGYGDLGERAEDRLRLYQAYHAVELWDWFASIGHHEPLTGIADTLRAIIIADEG